MNFEYELDDFRILFPGGGTYFNESGGYGEAGTILYNYAKIKNLPVWGICLGMELIAFAEANSVDHRIQCKALKEALPLLFKPGINFIVIRQVIRNALRHKIV